MKPPAPATRTLRFTQTSLTDENSTSEAAPMPRSRGSVYVHRRTLRRPSTGPEERDDRLKAPADTGPGLQNSPIPTPKYPKGGDFGTHFGRYFGVESTVAPTRHTGDHWKVDASKQRG